ncbi:MAG: hypothetical protein UU47_C0003G0059 [candidate division TM6 bacterium GW2011_GWE2_41_16]|nr:MAG: hypothetical protein UU47_C0003G0059 [candidate division TM6 bacterium GW2011_GWE2_41_16]
MHVKENVSKKTVSVLMIGDIVGIPGRALLQSALAHLRDKYCPDLVIVNGENSAKGGRGITPAIVSEFERQGVDVITGGNHSFSRKEIVDFISTSKTLLRPLNYPSGCPGSGIAFISLPIFDRPIAVVNLQGRVFMRELLLCPFKTLETALTLIKSRADIVLVDFHAEATSEKMGLAHYFDGQVSAIVGTHTHVPTADEKILPKGTAFVTDLGMCGSTNSMLGMNTESVLQNLITQMPSKFSVSTKPPFVLTGVVLCIGVDGKAQKIERVSVTRDMLSFDEFMFRD